MGGEVALPGSIVHQDHVPALWLVELQAGLAGERVDQVSIHQRLQAQTQIDGFGGRL